MINKLIKAKMFEENIPQWKVARALGISESTYTRRLRSELPKEEQEKIVRIINQIVKEEKE